MTGFEEITLKELREHEKEWERFTVDSDQAKKNEYFWAIWLNETLDNNHFRDCRAIINKVRAGEVQKMTVDRDGIFLNVTLTINSEVSYMELNIKLDKNVTDKILNFIDKKVNKLRGLTLTA